MVDSKSPRCSSVPTVLGSLLLAAGAADSHDLIVSARDADWALLIRADLEWLAGIWLLSGRFTGAGRIAAIASCGGFLARDLLLGVASHPPRPILGRILVGSGWVLLSDLFILGGLLLLRTAPKGSAPSAYHGRRAAIVLLVATVFGVAIDRAYVGQFPIITTVRAERTSCGLDYLVYLPDGYYRSLRRWPMILTLHGRGEAGDDINLVRHQGLPRRVEEKGGIPFVVVAPQSPDWQWDIGALEILVDEVLKGYRIDQDRAYLTGSSMGGNGAWALSVHRPEIFAAIAPICGRGDAGKVRLLTTVPTWAFHGAVDRVVPP
jgi:hypothetical protein